GHAPGPPRLELPVVVLERADRRLRHALAAHLLDGGAQSVLAHRADSSRVRNRRAPSTDAPRARTRADRSASEVATMSPGSTSSTISSSAALRPRRLAWKTRTGPCVPSR